MKTGQSPYATVYHAGTKLENEKLVTSGGRVLGVTSTAPTLKEALEKSYRAVESIRFKGAHYRKTSAQKRYKTGFLLPVQLEFPYIPPACSSREVEARPYCGHGSFKPAAAEMYTGKAVTRCFAHLRLNIQAERNRKMEKRGCFRAFVLPDFML